MAIIRNLATNTSEKEEKKALNLSSISPPEMPVKHKSIVCLEKNETLPRTTFHQVNKMIEKDDKELLVCYLKENTPGSPVSELEAVCAALYKLIAPYHIPSTYAVYDKSNVPVGVMSEEIMGFKSIATDPLKEEDLQVNFIAEKKLSIDILEELDEKYRNLVESSERYDRRARKLVDNKNKINIALEQLKSDMCVDEKKFDDLFKELETNSFSILNNEKNIFQAALEKNKFFKEIEKKYNITKKEFENYRIVKGLSLCLTTSYIFMEDDLHQNNLSKYGMRIDFDMSLWRLLYFFKDSKLIKFREPSEKTFKVTPNDILHFPNIKDATPFYWPTNSMHVFSDSVSTSIKTFLHMSTNAYPHQVNTLYQKLEKNPVFIYHKFNTLVKLLLVDIEIYRSVVLQNIRKKCSFEGQPLIDLIMCMLGKRIEEFETELVKIPDFLTFICTEGYKEKIIAQIQSELSKQNISVNLENIQKSFDNLSAMAVMSNDKLSGSFEKVKIALYQAMQEYQNPGVWSVGGFFRSHAKLATDLITFSGKISPKTDDKPANIQALGKLRVKITEELEKIPSGEMRTQLTKVLNLIKLFLPEQKSSNTLTA